ncbi:MAG TPA: histidine--tRNA ligase, partial [Pirellulales bacterium]
KPGEAALPELALRFDLTVPLARFVAQHINELGTPFKRYHIATVWRGENTSRGRYREFMQCDFDTIGTRSVAADAETALVIHDLLRAIGFERFRMRVNDRAVLTGLLEKAGLGEQAAPVLRAIDKLPKIGPEKVAAEMASTAAATPLQTAEILKLVTLTGGNEEILRQLDPLVAGSEKGTAGVARLRELLAATSAAGLSGERFKIDLSIARGLDYYTGVVYETFLEDLPEIGSVCSGGRYDNLAGLYTDQELPGVGASLGLDRLLAGMEELGMIEKVSTPAEIIIPFFAADQLPAYLRLAAQLRQAGFGVEVYPDAKKLGPQLKYADRRGFRVALVMGENELAAGSCQVKHLTTGGASNVTLANGAQELIAELHRLLALK